MDATQLTKVGATVGTGAGIAISGTIGAPVVVAGIIGCVAVGGLCAIAGMIAANASEGEMSINKGGFTGKFKKQG